MHNLKKDTLIESLTPSEAKEFLASVGSIGGATKIFQDGVQYVDNASFWKWLTSSYKQSQHLNSAKAIEAFVKNSPDKIQGIRSLIGGKGAEWDIAREYRPGLFTINKFSPNTIDPIKDIVSYNPISGGTEFIQAKTALKNPSAVAKGLLRYPHDVKFAVNQSVYDEATKIGIPKNRFVKVVPDKQLQKMTDKRMNIAKAGAAEAGVTVTGALSQIGQGAVIGVIIGATITTLSYFKAYKRGEISKEEYFRLVAKDAAKGGLLGSSFAALNIPVQIAATSLGLAAPVTIPVMIILGYGLAKVIDPIFKDGSYREILENMHYYTDATKALADFGQMSVYLFDVEKTFTPAMMALAKDLRELHDISNKLDEEIVEKLKGMA